MCLTTTTTYFNNSLNMLQDYASSRDHSSSSWCCSSHSSHTDTMLLDRSDLPTSMTKTCSSETVQETDTDENLLDESMSEVLMSSISLDDSGVFLDLDNDTNHSAAPYQEETLFNSIRQQYEWSDDFSLLIKLKTSRLSTIVEGDEL